jgi:hypothetical protein
VCDMHDTGVKNGHSGVKNVIIIYVNNIQKLWKLFLLTGMQTGIPQEAIDKLVQGSSPLKTMSYKQSRIRGTASAMVYVNGSFVTIADAMEKSSLHI